MTNTLIARLEAATGPDRELDAEIALTFDLASAFFSKHRYWSIKYGDEVWNSGTYPNFNPDTGKANEPNGPPLDWAWEVGLPEFTASLDAALTLVPEGWAWLIQKIKAPKTDRYVEVDICEADLWLPPANTKGLSCERYREDAATPAIALIIACLKARQQEVDRSDPR